MSKGMPEIICISGHARSGKETVARMLGKIIEASGYKVLIAHYADLLKFMCVNFFGWNGIKDEKGRTLLQEIGTEVIRECDPDYWVRFLIDCMGFFGDSWDYVLIPDTRFRNEIYLWSDCGYKAVHLRVERPGFKSQLTTEQRNHISEKELDHEQADFYVVNDCGLDGLYLKVVTIAGEVINERGQR